MVPDVRPTRQELRRQKVKEAAAEVKKNMAPEKADRVEVYALRDRLIIKKKESD